MPIPSAVELVLTDEERAVLESWIARRKTAQAVALRARIVLAAAGHLTNGEIAELEGMSRATVTKWRNRCREAMGRAAQLLKYSGWLLDWQVQRIPH